MSTQAPHKVTASHLKRSAYLYVRQSTVRQVFENTESTQRQYALRRRASQASHASNAPGSAARRVLRDRQEIGWELPFRSKISERWTP